MHIEDLLTEISPDAACGPDLEYDADFMALEQAARGKPEQQFGETIVPAVEPNWIDVRNRAEALLSRTKDLRVAVLLTRALLRQSEIAGLRDGVVLLLRLLERYWEGVHPRLDAEDDNDPTMRLNALGALIDADGMLRDAREMNVISAGAAGRVTVRDILVAAGRLPASADVTQSLGQLQGVIQAAADKHADTFEAARESLRALRDMQALLNDRLGSDRAPNLQPLTEIVELVVRTCDGATGEGMVAAQTAGAPDTAAAALSAGLAIGGEIRTREDAIRVLERVCEFMERTEPSNPAPLLIRRAQRLVSKNFIEIMEDLAPDSLGAIKGIAGL